MNLALSCPMRGGRAELTIPKDPLLSMFPPGLLNCAWLKILKNSPRISNAIFSLIAVRFRSPKSVLLKPGPWKNLWLAVPKVPQSGLGSPAALNVQLVLANALGRK